MTIPSMRERIARAIAPTAWAALGLADTLAQQNRRTASLRHADAVLAEMMEPSDGMREAGDDKLSSGSLVFGQGVDDVVVIESSAATEVFTAMIQAARDGH